MKDENQIQRCPYCGVELLTRYDMRQHLTLRICQKDGGEIIKPDKRSADVWDTINHSKDEKRQ